MFFFGSVLKIRRFFQKTFYLMVFGPPGCISWWFQIRFVFNPIWANDPFWLKLFKGAGNHQLEYISFLTVTCLEFCLSFLRYGVRAARCDRFAGVVADGRTFSSRSIMMLKPQGEIVGIIQLFKWNHHPNWWRISFSIEMDILVEAKNRVRTAGPAHITAFFTWVWQGKSSTKMTWESCKSGLAYSCDQSTYLL